MTFKEKYDNLYQFVYATRLINGVFKDFVIVVPPVNGVEMFSSIDEAKKAILNNVKNLINK